MSASWAAWRSTGRGRAVAGTARALRVPALRLERLRAPAVLPPQPDALRRLRAATTPTAALESALARVEGGARAAAPAPDRTTRPSGLGPPGGTAPAAPAGGAGSPPSRVASAAARPPVTGGRPAARPPRPPAAVGPGAPLRRDLPLVAPGFRPGGGGVDASYGGTVPPAGAPPAGAHPAGARPARPPAGGPAWPAVAPGREGLATAPARLDPVAVPAQPGGVPPTLPARGALAEALRRDPGTGPGSARPVPAAGGAAPGFAAPVRTPAGTPPPSPALPAALPSARPRTGSAHRPWPGMPWADLPAPGPRTRDLAAGDLPAGDLPAGDLPAGDLPAGDLPAGDLPAGDLAAGDLAARDRGRDLVERVLEDLLRREAEQHGLGGATP